MLESVQIETADDPRAAVIWLHGLGADGHDFEPIVPQLAWRGQPAIRYVFPHAPTRPVTINNGMIMRAWYDITGFDMSQRVDEAGIQASRDDVLQLIEQENQRGIATDRIILAGFSQGGAVALYSGLRLPHRLAGLVALSSYLPLGEETLAEADDANRSTPILMCHGTLDPVVPLQMGRMSADVLRSLGYPVTWHTYPVPHSVCPEEIVAVRDFLAACLARRNPG